MPAQLAVKVISVKKQHHVPVSVFLGDLDISSDSPARIEYEAGAPVEVIVPVRLGVLGWLSLRFDSAGNPKPD